MKDRIYLSAPNIDKNEYDSLAKTLDEGWIAPVGPQIDEFESNLEKLYEGKSVVALNSGTSALHMALILAGVSENDRVIVNSFTFAACANVVRYQKAIPVFMDSESETWNLDPDVLKSYLKDVDRVPKAIIVTHLYGMPARMNEIIEVAREYNVLVIEDAAESLGSNLNNKPVGSFGHYGILSFNGNKIVTTSGGGALVCMSGMKDRAIHLATQANLGSHGYEHNEVGYNYRLSNVLAGIGLSQLRKLEQFVNRKRNIYEKYKNELGEFLEFSDEPKNFFSNRWLTTSLLKEGNSIALINYLNKENVESRLLWKPLHMHKAYDKFQFIGATVAEGLFKRGICLPSGTGMTDDQQEYVIKNIRSFYQS